MQVGICRSRKAVPETDGGGSRKYSARKLKNRQSPTLGTALQFRIRHRGDGGRHGYVTVKFYARIQENRGGEDANLASVVTVTAYAVSLK